MTLNPRALGRPWRTCVTQEIERKTKTKSCFLQAPPSMEQPPSKKHTGNGLRYSQIMVLWNECVYVSLVIHIFFDLG